MRTRTCCVGIARSSKMQVPVVGRHSEALPQPGLILWLQNVAQRRWRKHNACQLHVCHRGDVCQLDLQQQNTSR